MDSLARDFVRYRERGDVAALGLVFDAVAARLAALAQLLCGDPADAEDLVQATFLLAIRKASSFDADRPLVPWLCGILEGEAHNLRRRRRRIRAASVGPEPIAAATAEPCDRDCGPAAECERRELVATVRAHVARLPHQQRQVLLLQLQHGLQPIEVAEVLGLAPGTVRMRIHRGMAALRRWLPASLSAWVALMRPPRGLPRVRNEVLRAGRRAAVAMGGTVIVQKWTFGIVAVLAVTIAVGGAVWWEGGTTAIPAQPDGPALVTGALAGAATASERAATAIDGSRAAVAVDRTNETTAAVARGKLHLRIVGYDDGRSMPRATAVVAQLGADGDPELTRRTATADEHGELRLALPVGEFDVAVHCGGHLRATIAAGRETELEARIMVGNRARGIVVLPDGRPAPGAAIVLASDGDLFGGGTTDADGRFDLPAVYPFHRVGARLPGYAPSALQGLDAGGDLRIELPGPAAVLLGRVVDASGAPIAGARVAVASEEPPEQWQSDDGHTLYRGGDDATASDAAGAFRLETGAGRQRLRAMAAGHVPAEVLATVVAGTTTDVALVLPRGERLDGVVCDEDGTPVGGVEVHLGSRDGPARTSAADGAFAFAAVPPGEVLAFLDGEAIDPLRAVRPASAHGTWRLTVQRWPQWRFRFVDDAGAPLAHAFVEVRARSHGGSAPTGEDGCVALRAPRDGATGLAITAIGAERKVRTRVPWPAAAVPDRETTVVVPAAVRSGAVVRGRLAATGGAGGRGLALLRTGTGPEAETSLSARAPAAMAAVAPLPESEAFAEDDGAFELAAAPGDHELVVRGEGELPIARFAVPALASGEARDLGVLQLPAQGELALQATLPGGAKPLDVVLVVEGAGGSTRVPWLRAAASSWPAGAFDYRLECSNALWCRGSFTVRAGATTTLAPVLVPAVLQRVQVMAPAEVPAGPAGYRVTGPDGQVRADGAWEPLRAGALQLSMPLTAGAWRIEVRWPDGRRSDGVGEFGGVPTAAPLCVALDTAR